MYLFAKKVGMTRFLDESGKFIPCTIFKPVEDCDASSFIGDFKYFDIQGKTIGRGFAGAMKRHGFGGLRASHGVSVSHRSHGSTGQCQDPGRVFKGKKMAGHMGCKNVTVQNLRYLDSFEGALIFSGCVPGNEKSIVRIRPAVKKYGKVSGGSK